MPIRTVSNAGGNYNATPSWVEAVVPTSSDDVVFTSTSGPLTVNVASVAKSINFTNYANTITFNNTLTISGSVSLGSSTYTQSGTSGISVNSSGTLVSGGVTWSRPFTFAGSSQTYTLSDNWTFTNQLTFGATTQVTINASTIYASSINVSTTGNVLGTTNIVLNGTGTWSHAAAGYISKNLTIDTLGSLAISGNVYFQGATLSYVTASSVTTTGSTLNIGSSCFLSTNGINWNNFACNVASTITLNSNLNINGDIGLGDSTAVSIGFSFINSSTIVTPITTNVTIGNVSWVGSSSFNPNGNVDTVVNFSSPIVFNINNLNIRANAQGRYFSGIYVGPYANNTIINNATFNVYGGYDVRWYNEGGVGGYQGYNSFTGSNTSIVLNGSGTVSTSGSGTNRLQIPLTIDTTGSYTFSSVAFTVLPSNTNVLALSAVTFYTNTITYNSGLLGGLPVAFNLCSLNLNSGGVWNPDAILIGNTRLLSDSTFKNLTTQTTAVVLTGSYSVNVQGNLAINTTTSGSTPFLINGTGSQTWTATSYLSNNLTINKPSGDLILSGNVYYQSGTFSYVTASSVITTGSTLNTAATTNYPASFGNINWNNLNFAGGTITLNSNVSCGGAFSSAATINGFTVSVGGNLAVNNTTNGTTNILISGTGSQTWTSAGYLYNNININKPSGTFSLSGNIYFGPATMSLISGSVSATSAALWLNAGGNVGLILGDSVTFGTIYTYGVTTTINLGNTLRTSVLYVGITGAGSNTVVTIPGTYSIFVTSTFYFGNGTFNGNTYNPPWNTTLTISNIIIYTSTFYVFYGSWSQGLNSGPNYNTINGGTISISGTFQNDFNTQQNPTSLYGNTELYHTGTLISGGSRTLRVYPNLTLNPISTLSFSLNSSVLYFSGSNLKYLGGTVSWNSHYIQIDNTSNITTGTNSKWYYLYFNSSATLVNDCNVDFFGIASATVLNSNNLYIYRDLSISSTLSGSTHLRVVGTLSQTWTATNWMDNNFTIDKTSGTFSIGPNVYYRTGTFSYVNGIVNTTTNRSTLFIGNSCIIKSQGITWYNVNPSFTGALTLGSDLAWSNLLAVSSGAPTFIGTGSFAPTSTAGLSFSGTSTVTTAAGLSNFTFSTITITSTGTTTVSNTLNCTGTVSVGGGAINGSTISNSGNLVVGGVSSGSTTIVMNGLGSQTWTASNYLGNNLIINKPSGDLILGPNIYYQGGTFSYVTGSVVTTNNTFNIGTTCNLNTNGITWYNVANAVTATVNLISDLLWTNNWNVTGGTLTFTGSGSLTASTTGNVAFSGSSVISLKNPIQVVNASLGLTTINSSTMSVVGNLIINNTTSGTTTLILSGTGGQTWSHTTATYLSNNLTINKPSGTLTLGPNIYYQGGTFSYVTGSVVTTNGTFSIGTTCNLNTNGITWYNITNTTTATVNLISDLLWTNNWNVTGGTLTFTGSGSLTASTTGNVAFSGSSVITLKNLIQVVNATLGITTINTSTMSIVGNLTINNTTSGTTTLILSGTGGQTWSHTTAAYLSNNLTINKPSGNLNLSSNVYFQAGTFSYISGSVNTTGTTFSIGTSCFLSTNGITWSNINTSVTGTTTLLNDLNFTGQWVSTAGSPAFSGLGRLVPGSTSSLNFSGSSAVTIPAQFVIPTMIINTSGTTTLSSGITCSTSLSTSGAINGHTMSITGDYTVTGTTTGTTVMLFNGTSLQTWTHSSAVYLSNTLNIDKSSGKLVLGNNVYKSVNAINYISGEVDALTNFTTLNTSGSLTLNTKAINWYNWKILGTAVLITLSSDIYISNLCNFSFSSASRINGSNIYTSSFNYTNTGTNTGTSTLVFNGDGYWANDYLRSIQINVTIDCNKLDLIGNPYFSGAAPEFTPTIRYTKGNINSKNGVLFFNGNSNVLNFNKVVLNSVKIASGATLTMNEFFSGSSNQQTIVSSTLLSNYTIRFNDNFEKVAKWVTLNNCTLFRPGQLTVVTNSIRVSSLTASNPGIRYRNDLPNGISKAASSPISQTAFPTSAFVSDPTSTAVFSTFKLVYESLTYVASANITLTNNGTTNVDMFKTSGSAAWDNQVYSTVAFTAPCTIEFNKQAGVTDNGLSYAMIGWNTDPLSDANYASLDYASYPYRTDTYSVYNNSTQVLFSGSWSTSNKFYIVYDIDGFIRHYNGNTLLYSFNWGTGRIVFVDSSYYSVNSTFGGFSNVRVTRSSWNGGSYV